MNKKITKIVVTSALVLGFGTATLAPSIASAAKATSAQVDNTAKINELIREKQQLILKKKTSRDWREQKALGIRIGEIEREIKALKKGQATGNNNGGAQVTPPAKDNTAKINELIKQKMELIQKKKVSRDKKEQKALGKQIDQIEKEIKQLKKAQYK